MGEEGLTEAEETPKGLEKADVAGASLVCPSREGADGLHREDTSVWCHMGHHVMCGLSNEDFGSRHSSCCLLALACLVAQQ